MSKAAVVEASRRADITLAARHTVWVVRADVAGRVADSVSYGSSGVVAPGGHVAMEASALTSRLLVTGLASATRSV